MRLDAIISLRMRPRDQAKWGQGEKGAENIERWCDNVAIVREGAARRPTVSDRWCAHLLWSSSAACFHGGHLLFWGLGQPAALEASRSVVRRCFQVEIRLAFAESRLDCAGATKPPKQGGKPMNELELNDGSGTKAANDRPFECLVFPRVFEIFNDCVGGKPSAPTLAFASAPSASSASAVAHSETPARPG